MGMNSTSVTFVPMAYRNQATHFIAPDPTTTIDSGFSVRSSPHVTMYSFTILFKVGSSRNGLCGKYYMGSFIRLSFCRQAMLPSTCPVLSRAHPSPEVSHFILSKEKLNSLIHLLCYPPVREIIFAKLTFAVLRWLSHNRMHV